MPAGQGNGRERGDDGLSIGILRRKGHLRGVKLIHLLGRQCGADKLLVVARAGNDGTAAIEDGEGPLSVELLPHEDLTKMLGGEGKLQEIANLAASRERQGNIDGRC